MIWDQHDFGRRLWCYETQSMKHERNEALNVDVVMAVGSSRWRDTCSYKASNYQLKTTLTIPFCHDSCWTFFIEDETLAGLSLLTLQWWTSVLYGMSHRQCCFCNYFWNECFREDIVHTHINVLRLSNDPPPPPPSFPSSLVCIPLMVPGFCPIFGVCTFEMK